MPKTRRKQVKKGAEDLRQPLQETKATLANPFYGFNPELSKPPKTNADFEERKYTG